jgi:hypothetical protein
MGQERNAVSAQGQTRRRPGGSPKGEARSIFLFSGNGLAGSVAAMRASARTQEGRWAAAAEPPEDGLLAGSPRAYLKAMGLPAVSFRLSAHCLRTRSFTAAGIGT